MKSTQRKQAAAHSRQPHAYQRERCRQLSLTDFRVDGSNKFLQPCVCLAGGAYLQLTTKCLDPQRVGVETSPRHAYHSGSDCTSSCSRLFEPGKRSSLDDQRLSSSALAKKPVSVHHHMHGFTRTLAHVPSNAKAASQCFTAERKLCASRRTLQQHKTRRRTTTHRFVSNTNQDASPLHQQASISRTHCITTFKRLAGGIEVASGCGSIACSQQRRCAAASGWRLWRSCCCGRLSSSTGF